MTFSHARTWLGALVVCTLASVSWAQLPTPDFEAIFPLGCQQGTSCEVSVRGQNFDAVERLIFSHPGITAAPVMRDPRPWEEGQQHEEGRFSVSIAADVPVGAYEVRAQGLYGISTPRTFVVGQLPEVIEADGNTAPDNAQEVPLNSVVNARANPRGYDYFRFNAQKGQRVLVELAAYRLDSQLDGVLVVYSYDGRELARVNDVKRRDPIFDFVVPETGTYTVLVHDLVFEGGETHAYRLKIHTGPQIDFVFPPAGVPGTDSKFTLYGRNLPDGQPTDLTLNGRPLEKLDVSIPVPDGRSTRQLDGVGYRAPEEGFEDAFAYRLTTADGRVSNPVPIGFCSQALLEETAENDTPEKATPVSAPAEIAGSFHPESDVDWYAFEAKAGDVLWIDLMSHRLGLPSDPLMIVQQVTKNDKGEEQVRDLKSVDDVTPPELRLAFDVAHRDPIWLFEAPADGTFRVMIRDLAAHGDRPQNIYRLRFAKPEPDFRLLAVPRYPADTNQNAFTSHSPVVRRGGSMWIDVLVQRRDGFREPVEIRMEGLPGGVSAKPVTLGPEAGWVPLILTANEDAAAWAGEVDIIGTATVNGNKLERHARSGSVIWPGVQNRSVGQSRVTERMMVGVSTAEASPYRVRIDGDAVFETARAGVLKIPVRVERRGEFKQDVPLVAIAAPKDWQAKNLTIKKDTETGELEINPKTTAPLGTYTFYLEAQAKDNYVRNQPAADAAQAAAKAAAEYQKEMQTAEAEAKKRKDEADRQLSPAQQAVRQAEQAKQRADEQSRQKPDDEAAKQEAEKTAGLLEEARAKLSAAEQEQREANEAYTAAQEAKKQADAWKTDEDARSKRLTDAAKGKNITIYEASTPITIHVREVPIEVTFAAPGTAIAPGAKLEVPVEVQRLFEFADAVDLEIKAPGGAKLKAAKVQLKKEESSGMVVVEVDPAATPGEYELIVEAGLKFNNQNLKATFPLSITVSPQS
jgi:hypothetical protein